MRSGIWITGGERGASEQESLSDGRGEARVLTGIYLRPSAS
jgi:hypothetical protein